MVTKLDFSKLLDPKDNRLPKKTGIGGKLRPLKTIPLFNPKIIRNPALAKQLDPIRVTNPQIIREAALKQLNSSVDTINRHLQKFKSTKGLFFEIDENSSRSFAVIKDKRTGEVLKEIPAQGVLQIAANLRDASGLIVSLTE